MAVAQAATNERSLRSVFVGNIPYDASEEKLKDIFSEVGPVLSFKLVYDRESGKPKGYGFCEYRDQETASSAMRNLNGYELNGRNLRVDTATNERFKEEMKNLQMSLSGNSFESPYGQEVDPEKTPETIAKVVASLPPEQMFELTRQMKHCVLTNPNEARNMLLQNPQLAYALLQALVVMKAVDINSASSILYKPNPPPISIPPGNVGPVPGMPAPPSLGMPQPMPHGVMPNQQPPPQQMPMPPVHQSMYEHPHDPHVGFNRPPMGVPGGPPPPQHQNFDQRHIDPRLRQNDPRPPDIFDPRVAAQPSAASAALDPRLRAQGGGGGAMDPRQMPQAQANVSQPPPGMRGPAPAPVVPISQPVPGGPQAPFGNRFGPPPSQTGPPIQVAPGIAPGQPMGPGQQLPPLQQPGAGGQSQSEQEKANLIMQVLALSDQQIAMLPAEQRQSIMQLKEQLTRGGQP